MSGRANTLADFEAKIEFEPNSGCWLWAGSLSNSKGYGAFPYQGQILRAHRAAWMFYRGEVTRGLFVCHHCDTPQCVNPAHLFLGTRSDNARDMVNKGRAWWQRGPEAVAAIFANGKQQDPATRSRGDSHYLAKISARDVPSIRLRRAAGESYPSIGRSLGVSRTTIRAIVTGRTWGHVK